MSNFKKKIIRKAKYLFEGLLNDEHFKGQYLKAREFLEKYPQQALTKEQKQAIDNYWKQFGIKFPDYTWQQMYYGVTGTDDPRFIPNPVAGYLLFPYYNNKRHIQGWDDKNLYERFLPGVHFPASILHCIEGCVYDADWTYHDRSQIGELSQKIFSANDLTDVIVKEARGSSAGKGVSLRHFHSAQELETFLTDEKSRNYILQEKIVQHPFMKQFNASSVNIIRIVSWRHEGEVRILSCSIRFGIEGSVTDVAYKDGEEIVNVVGVDPDGNINGRFVTFNGLMDTPPVISEKTVPCFERLIRIVKDAHRQMYPFGVIGWDFTIDKDCNPTCIEYNIEWPGVILYQFCNGPFAREFTDEFLAPLNSKKVRIPRCLRA